MSRNKFYDLELEMLSKIDANSDADIYAAIGISKAQFYRWLKKYPNFSATISKIRKDFHNRSGFHNGKHCHNRNSFHHRNSLNMRLAKNAVLNGSTVPAAARAYGIKANSLQRNFDRIGGVFHAQLEHKRSQEAYQ